MRHFAGTLLVLAVVLCAGYVFRAPLFVLGFQAYARLLPCTRPIPYAIGSIDPGFNLSTSSALAVLKKAANIWNTAAGKDLFVYDPDMPVVTISFAYDNRQKTTDTLKRLGLSVSTDMASYEAVRAKYDSLLSDYTREKSDFETRYAAYQARSAAYAREVDSWNTRGGAPSSAYARLNREQSELESQRSTLQSDQEALNRQAADVNALVGEINKLASALNIKAANYNKVGSSIPKEFEEGVYMSALGRERIEIYEFNSSMSLVRVLAHEFGHALGLEHVAENGSIMYELNQSGTEKPTAADIAQLTRVCRLASK